ncbi:MAG: TonB family protein [Gammaproteobacteria bacterium]|nr:TonB family protein [Gammaproteobacteria bacterium]
MYLVDAVFVSIRDFLARGGDVLLVISATIFLMWALILDRLIYLSGEHPQRTRETVAKWHERKDRESWHSLRIYEASVADLGMRLQRGIPMIKTLAALCPLLGLLGTVLGMISIFETSALLGNSSPRTTAGGVSMAIVTTMAGMVGALSGIFPSAYLARRYRSSVQLARAAQQDPSVVARVPRIAIPPRLRVAIAPLGAITITLVLLLTMEHMIVTGRNVMTGSVRTFQVDFVRIPEQTVVARRDRRPERPENVEEPPEWEIDRADEFAGAAGEELLAVAAPRVAPDDAVAAAFSPSGFVGDHDGDYLPIVKVAPVYPRRALVRREEGWVLLRFTVLNTGAVANIEVVESSNEIFEEAAVRAAAKFKYRPRIIDGQPIEVRGVLHRITFVLRQRTGD